MRKQSMSELASLLKQEAQAKGGGAANKQIFQFWQAPPNTTTVIRPLPRLEEDAPFPWLPRRTHRIQMEGMIHSDYDTDGPVMVKFASPETFGAKDPITLATRHLWNGSEDEKNVARRGYRKETYLIGATIVSSAWAEPSPPENPNRIIELTRSIFKNFRAGLEEADFEMVPWDYEFGRDFKIVKTMQGQWPNYSTSAFSYRARALSQAELAGIEKYNLPDLQKELGEPPTQEAIGLMLDLWNDALANRPFDNAKYGAHFRAFPIGNGNGEAQAAEPTPPRNGGPGTAEAVEEVLDTLKSKTKTKVG